MKFGLPVWHGNIESIEDEIARAIALGFDYVEISLDYPWPELLSKKRIGKIIRLAEKSGIRFAFHAPPEGVAIGSPFPETRKEAVKFILFLVKWSGQFKPLYLNFHGSAGELFSNSEDELLLGAILSATRRSAREIRIGAQKSGVKVTFENTPDPIFGISGNIDFILGSRVRFCLDLGHSEIVNGISRDALGKEDRQYEKWAKLSGKHILALHLHRVKRGQDHYPFSEKDRRLKEGYLSLARKTGAKFTTIEIMKEERGAVHKVSDATMKACLEIARSWAGGGERPGKGVVYSIKQEHLPFLRSAEHGKVVSGEVREADLPKGRKIIVVGDECSAKISQNSVFSLFYDGKTRRRKVFSKEKLRKLASFSQKEIFVNNPKGNITAELWAAAKAAIAGKRKVFVRGEEDLAALAILALAPLGTVVVYGIPKKGSCILEIGRRERKSARMLIGKGVDYALL